MAKAGLSPAGTSALLIVLALAWPEAPLVRALTGRSRLDAELVGAQTRGYYETLLDADPKARALASTVAAPEADIATPPPGWVNFADSGIVEDDPGYGRWRLRPNVDILWNGERFRTNSLGLRSPEVALPKPPGTFRVVVLGSSNTIGHGVDDDSVYVRHLERWLNRVLEPSGRQAEVVNLAVSGDAPSQRLHRLATRVEPLGPDWILCDATVLDVSLEARHLETIRKRGTPVPLAYVREALASAGVSADEPLEAFRDKIRGVSRELLDGAYAGWAAEARRLDVPLTVLMIPRADKIAESPELLRLSRTLAARHRLDYLDVSDAFRGMTLDQFRVSPWDRHPSRSGHLAIFRALRDRLIERGSLPGLHPPARLFAAD